MDVPHHVAVIMDGNARWAKDRSLNITQGYKNGAENALNLLRHSLALGIKCLTLFAFSTENWGREKKDVECILSLFVQYIAGYVDIVKSWGVKINFFGEVDLLPDYVLSSIERAHYDTKDNNDFKLCVAISYGGRQEILNSVKAMLKSSISAEEVDEKLFSNFLYTNGTNDPDLIIRTGGQKRLSNFLLWQSAYSELYFADKLWPDFNQKDLQDAIKDYKKRVRKYGK